MRFRISTVLIAIVAVAILTGWMTDRSIQRNSEDQIVDRERTAARIFFRSQAALNALDSVIVKGDDDNQITLVRAIIDLSENEELYNDSSFSFSYDANTRAEIILGQLGHKSPEEFRTFAVTLYPFMSETEQVAYRDKNNILLNGFIDPPNEKHYPEFYDPNSDEYRRLDTFLHRAIETMTNSVG